MEKKILGYVRLDYQGSYMKGKTCVGVGEFKGRPVAVTEHNPKDGTGNGLFTSAVMINKHHCAGDIFAAVIEESDGACRIDDTGIEGLGMPVVYGKVACKFFQVAGDLAEPLYSFEEALEKVLANEPKAINWWTAADAMVVGDALPDMENTRKFTGILDAAEERIRDVSIASGKMELDNSIEWERSLEEPEQNAPS